ncbi:MAG: hypothetical protein IJ722_07160 [Alloprevotella sp.]|nr:hypothetical protein [Alloprevotella sp.]
MDERMNKNNALPADVPAAETCAESAPQGAKKYVKPTTQVFPLGCGLLAVSGGVPPVTVTVLWQTLDPYLYANIFDIIDPVEVDGRIISEPCEAGCCYHYSDEVELGSFNPCDYLGGGGNMLDAWTRFIEDKYPSSRWNSFTESMCYKLFAAGAAGILDRRSLSPEWFIANPSVTIEGADWPIDDFLLNAQFSGENCDDDVIGTYRGQRFLFKLWG